MDLRNRQLAYAAILFLLAYASENVAGQQPVELPAQITPVAVQKVKKATILLKATTDRGQTLEGSGFLAGEPGLIFTNAHVLGMLGAKNKPPTKVTAIVHSGEREEMELTAKVLGVDRSNDLAVLRVDGKVPDPLELGPDAGLYETQKVYIFGFPFGTELGKNITVSDSSVSSLRKAADGTLDTIQVNGGMHPGNSGGPVVNSMGQVVGVSVAVIRNTQIDFAIPASLVKALLAGRIQELTAKDLYRQNEKVLLPLQCECVDPLQRIREVRVDVWSGKPANKRPYSAKEAGPQPGDGPRQTVRLTYVNGRASGDVPLGEVAEGQVAWVQPNLLLASGEQRWGPPRAFEMTSIVERVPAQLVVKLSDQKERSVHLHSTQSLTFTKARRKFVAAQAAELDLLETCGPNPKGTQVRIGFGPPALTLEEDGKKTKASEQVASLLQRAPPSFVIDATNKLRERTSVNLNPRLAPTVREEVNDYLSMISNSYEAANFILPNRQLQAKDTWNVKLPLLLKTGAKPEIVDLNMVCTYEGAQKHSAGPQALVSFRGQVKSRKSQTNQLPGLVTGKFTFDENAGFISSVKMVITSEFSASDDSQAAVAFEIDLTRVEGNPKKIALPRQSPSLVNKVTPKLDASPVNKGGELAAGKRAAMSAGKHGEVPAGTKFTKPSPSKSPVSYLKVASSPGDRIGQGKTYDYGGDQLVIRPMARGLNVSVDGWRLSIGAPVGQALDVGEYLNAKRFAFSREAPGLEFSGKGRGSNRLDGEFVVWELEISDGKIVKLAIDFTQRSEGKDAPLRGKLRFNSTLE